MSKYRKKPVVIEAVRWDGKLVTLHQLQKSGMETTIYSIGTYPIEICNLRVKTLEGEHIADIGDWIIKGVKGEFYPCKPDIFEMTYEKENSEHTLTKDCWCKPDIISVKGG